MTLGRIALVALAAALLAAPTGAAATRVVATDTRDYPTVRVTVVTGSASDPAPTVSEGGKPATALRATNLGRTKSVVLAIDRSRSMVGQPLDDAVAAARGFIAAKRPADRIAIVLFGSRALQLTGFSSSTIDADTALRTVQVDGRSGTALHDAVALSASMLGGEQNGARVLLLVTDGKDVSSRIDMATAIARARAAGTAVYAVGVEGRQFSPDALQAIADATGGAYHGASSSGELTTVYANVAAELERTWQLEFVAAARPGERAQLVVGSERLSVLMPGRLEPRGDSRLPSALRGTAGTVAIGAGVGLLLLLGVVFALGSGGPDKLRSRVAAHLQQSAPRRPRAAKERIRLPVATLLRATESVFGKTRIWRRLERALERADLPLSATELAFVTLGSTLGIAVVASLLGASGPAVFVLMILAASGPRLYVWWKGRARALAFENQLPDFLMSVSASLKAGHTFRQGIQSAAEEGNEPTSKELRRVLTETRLGRPVEESLGEMAERLGSKNFAFVVTAVNIQNQVGGSLSTILDMVSDTVRQRQQFQRKIRSLTAMGRMSAYVLVALPFVVAGALAALNPGYMSPLFHTSTGNTLIFIGLGMMMCGALVLKKIVSFKG